MIDNNIIQSLGVGSGIDTNNLVKQLVAVERLAPQGRIDTKTELAETKISDFGLLSNALSTLKDAAAALVDPEALFSKSASFTDSDALVPVELDTDVQSGSYSFNVSQVAKSNTLAFAGFTDAASAVGEGTLTFNLGAWARDVDGDIDLAAPVPIFTQDTSKESFAVTIDSTNNSLEGLRDAINAADQGVTASIINDGSSYRLSIVAESGAQNEIEITVAESGGSPTNDDQSDLSRFAFNASLDGTGGKLDINSIDAQGGQNAMLTLNGIDIERSSNTVDDLIQGLTLDVLKEMDPTESVTITISDDKAFAEQNVRTFVESYNLFLEAVGPAIGTSEVENEDGETETVIGSLANDALAKSMLTQVRTLIATSIPGLSDSNFTSLTNIGIRTELDGSLSIDEDDFSTAFDDNFEDVQKLFAPFNSSTSDQVYVNSFNDSTTAGEYEVAITQTPTHGVYSGAALGAIVFPLDTTGKTYTFEVTVNGADSASLTIPTATYDDEAAMAAAIQSLINSDTTVEEAGAEVTVSYNSGTGAFDITSDSYGSNSNVTISAASADSIADLGLTVASGTAGLTAVGTVNGEAAFGSANVLLPALGEPGAGLAMIIGGTATTATVSFSRGFAGELERLIDSFLDASGVIATRTETLNDNLESFESEQDRLDRRITAYEERLMNQFIAMERILSSLNSSGSFLDSLIDTLPFTASKK